MPEVCANCVLLVDDDPSIRDILSRQLGKKGFETIHAEDGIDALVKLRNSLPKVIICDLQMPRMSGFEFIRVVRRRFPSIPVVVLAGSIPSEFSEGIKPDCWFEKSMLQFPEFLQTINYLARKTPDQVPVPQVINIPIRVRPGSSGYIFLTCTDCLRSFEVASTPGKSGEQTAICTYCQASVPFLIESPDSR
jgi:CheY-like chemotaxis protein